LGPLGQKWDHNYDRKLLGIADAAGTLSPFCDGTINYQDGNLGLIHFTPVPHILAGIPLLPISIATITATIIKNPWAALTGLAATASSVFTSVQPIPAQTSTTITALSPAWLQRILQGATTPSLKRPPPKWPLPSTQINYATSPRAKVHLRYDSSLWNSELGTATPWVMTDLSGSGLVSYFDAAGRLVLIQHPAGPKMKFYWSDKLDSIVDTTGRWINLIYKTVTWNTVRTDGGATWPCPVGHSCPNGLTMSAKHDFLQCLSLSTTCDNPLVTYAYGGLDNPPLKECSNDWAVCEGTASNNFGELTDVGFGKFPDRYGNIGEGGTHYQYTFADLLSKPLEPQSNGQASLQDDRYIADELAGDFCRSLCSPRTKAQCRNDDICNHNKCNEILSGNTLVSEEACVNYLTSICPGAGAICKALQVDPSSTADKYCLRADFRYQLGTACSRSLPSYCSANDQGTCIAMCESSVHVPVDKNSNGHLYHFGVMREQKHNLVFIADSQPRSVIVNKYGPDPTDVSFNKVTDQLIGEVDKPENHVTFEYHDLKLEAQASPNPPGSNPPSQPNPSLVVPRSQFQAKWICMVAPSLPHSGGSWPLPFSSTSQYSPYNAYTHGGGGSCIQGVDGNCLPPIWRDDLRILEQLAQVPRWATVIHDLGGVVKTKYFDEKWNLLREVNHATGEQTDYNYDSNGFLIAQRNPGGDVICSVLQAGTALPAEVDHFPADGSLGAQDPIVTMFVYDSALQLTDVITDPDGDNIKIHYERDAQERVKWIDRSVDASTTERTTYDYDPGNPFPKTVTSPGGSVTKYDGYDPVGAAPKLVTVGADSPSPIQTYSVYYHLDQPFWTAPPDVATRAGRVAELGKVNLAATRYQYAITGRVTQKNRRYDANSPWIATTTNLTGVWQAQPLVTADPNLVTTTFTNSQGDLVWRADQAAAGSSPPKRFTCFHYDGEHHLLETILPEGNSIVYSYDGQWRRTSTSKGMRGVAPTDAWAKSCASNTEDWSGALETLASTNYGPDGWVQSKTVEGVTTNFVNDGFGRPIETIDASGIRQRGYDRQGRVAWEAVMQPRPPLLPAFPYGKPNPPDIRQVAQFTEFGYDHLGRTVSVTRWHIEDQTKLVKTIRYLDLQRTVVETEAGLTTTLVFDGAGRLVSKTLPDYSTVTNIYSGDSGSVITSTTQTNNPNKPNTTVTTTLDGLGFVHTSKDDLGTLIHGEAHDIDGHLVESDDLAGNATTQFEYDAFGRVKTEWKTFENDRVQTASYVYDRDDRRTSITDGKSHRTFLYYDAVDRLSFKRDPVQRLTGFTYYSGTRRVWVQTDPSGATFTRTYDLLGRPHTETTTPGKDVDVGARQTTFGYDVVGHLSEVDYAGSGLQGWDNNVTMQFDSLGRKLREANSLFSFDVKHNYDINGTWMTTTVADSATERQSFDSLRRLAGVSLNGTTLAAYHYGASGVGGPLSIGYATGATTSLTYDQRNRLTDVSVQQAGSRLLSMHTALGADGVPRERVYSIGGNGVQCPPNATVCLSSGRTITNAFQVDLFGRVTAESLDIPNATALTGDVTNANVANVMQLGARWRSYGLDATSNWASWDDNQSGKDQPVIDGRNAYTAFAGKQPIYDSADNATSIPNPSGDEAYTFDVYKHPLTATKNNQAVSFHYDGLGRRILEQDASGTQFILWDGNQLVAHGDSPKDVSKWKLEVGGADIDEHVASIDALGLGPVHVYHQAVDGSVIGVSDSTGLIEAYTYSAFGEVSTYGGDGTSRTASTLGTRFLYHGQLFDPWTRTYSMRAREYRPAWGRFLSTDPIGLDGGLNLYAFASGGPLHLRDPMGTTPSCNPALQSCLNPADNMSTVNSSNPTLQDLDNALYSRLHADDTYVDTRFDNELVHAQLQYPTATDISLMDSSDKWNSVPMTYVYDGSGNVLGSYPSPYGVTDPYAPITDSLLVASGAVPAVVPGMLVDDLAATGTTTFYRGMTYGDALETVEAQGLSAARISANQALNPGAAGSGAYLSSQEGTAAYFGDLAGVQGRGLGPAVVRMEVDTAEFNAFAARNGISIETLIPRGPFPGATETLIPMHLIDEFNALASFFMHL